MRGVMHGQASGRTCCCLHAGFPLTDRDLSTSFAVLSAHAPGQVNWAAHKGIDTLVLLMAGAKLQASVAGMLQAGWPADIPVQPPVTKHHLQIA